MQRLLLALFVVLALATVAWSLTPTTADENNPRTNPDANACYSGGSLYGKCETYDLNHDKTVDVEEIKYMYTAGWYIIRFDKGMILRSQVPRMYRWLLGAEPTPEYIAPTAVGTITPTPFFAP